MEFHFKVYETNVGTIQINAEDYETALAQANDAYFQSQTNWQDGSWELCFDKSKEEKDD